MKVLHTSDLHLGKCLLEESFYEDQKHILNEIIKIIEEKNVDVALIAGDIYDKNIPSVDAVNLLDDFLKKLSEMNIQVLIISGNHDSNDRLSYGAKIFEHLNIHIESIYSGKMKILSYDDVDFYMLPFIKPFHLKKLMKEEEYETITNSNEMMKWVLKQERINPDKKNILLLHQFVMNTGENIEFSDSESMTNVGTLDAIDVNLLDDFDYVALGHIHRPQKIKRDTVRYSGTPLKYSFSEVNNKNGVVIYDTNNESVEIIELTPLRNMRVLKGTFEEIMQMERSNDLIRVELLDENTIISPMEDIKKKFPGALSLGFPNKASSSEEIFSSIESISKDFSPIKLFDDFFELQQGRNLNEEEINYLNKMINNLEEEM